MFAKIETNGATHIIINVPHDGAEKSLPALAAMLERNAVFIQAGWNEKKIVEPVMSVILGDKVELCSGRDEDIAIRAAGSGEVIGESFVIASNEVFVSNARAIKAKDDELSRLRSEIAYVKNQLEAKTQEADELARRLTATGAEADA